jgi:hypothetical protein
VNATTYSRSLYGDDYWDSPQHCMESPHPLALRANKIPGKFDYPGNNMTFPLGYYTAEDGKPGDIKQCT